MCADQGKQGCFERIDGGEIVRVRIGRRHRVGEIKFTIKIRKGRKNAKWSRTRKGHT